MAGFLHSCRGKYANDKYCYINATYLYSFILKLKIMFDFNVCQMVNVRFGASKSLGTVSNK